MLIEKYEFGSVFIDGKEIKKDIVLFKDELFFRDVADRHIFDATEIETWHEKIHADMYIFGIGYDSTAKVSVSGKKYLTQSGLEYTVTDSRNAVTLYNYLVSEKKVQKICLFLHLTC